MLYERDVLKNIDKLKKSSGVNWKSHLIKKSSPKDVLKIFVKFTEKYLCGNLFFKLQAGNLKLPETATGDVQ